MGDVPGRPLPPPRQRRHRLDRPEPDERHRKWDTLAGLYWSDPRVSPWAGTAHGVLQAVNTYEHHQGVVRGERAERNGLKTITGDFGRLDRTTWKTLTAVLEQPLPALTA